MDERHYFAKPFGVPPLDEQDKIIEHVESLRQEIREAQAKAHREITLVREYRTRLISDIVTGKLDVRGVDPPEPEKSGVVSGLDEPKGDGTGNPAIEAEEVPGADL